MAQPKRPPLIVPEMIPESSKIKLDWKHISMRSGLLMISGFSDGTAEVLKVKYECFQRSLPGESDQFWDYNISWKNKYKNGIAPDAKFFGSKNIFVFTTDGYHLMRAIRNSTMIAAMVIPIGSFKNKPLKHYIIEAVVYYVSYTMGFNLAYDVVFK
jgi:hypothetical protein